MRSSFSVLRSQPPRGTGAPVVDVRRAVMVRGLPAAWAADVERSAELQKLALLI